MGVLLLLGEENFSRGQVGTMVPNGLVSSRSRLVLRVRFWILNVPALMN